MFAFRGFNGSGGVQLCSKVSKTQGVHGCSLASHAETAHAPVLFFLMSGLSRASNSSPSLSANLCATSRTGGYPVTEAQISASRDATICENIARKLKVGRINSYQSSSLAFSI